MTAPSGKSPPVAESPSGMRHTYRTVRGVSRTFCGIAVPKYGWFGPIKHAATCARCMRAEGES